MVLFGCMIKYLFLIYLELPGDKSFFFVCQFLRMRKCNLYAHAVFVCCNPVEGDVLAQFLCANMFGGNGLEA